MIEIIGIFKDRTIKKTFNNILDAIDFRDDLDAQYARVIWKKL
jgi:hypothetical protein